MRFCCVGAQRIVVLALLAMCVNTGTAAALGEPSVTSVNPSSGSSLGGTTVTISGTGFSGAIGVVFGSSSAGAFSVVDDSTITATAPPGSPGPVDVTVSTLLGTSATGSADQYTYVAAATTVRGVPQPTSRLVVSGVGFLAGEAVDVYFDNANQDWQTATDAGAFTSRIQVPTSAVPGQHWVTAVGATSGVVAQSRETVLSPWPQFGYAATHVAVNRYENSITGLTVATLRSRFAKQTQAPVRSSAAVSGATVIFGSDDGNVYDLWNPGGAVRWVAAVGGSISASPAVVGNLVYVASTNGMVNALKLATGAAQWSATAGTSVSASPTVVGGTVYVPSADGNLYALDANTGQLRWSTFLGGSLDASAAVLSGVLYEGSSDGSVYAVQALTGSIVWAQSIGSSLSSSPTLANGRVYVGSSDGLLYALNQATGAIAWTGATGGAIKSSPAAVPGRIYVGSDDGHLYAFDTNGCPAPPCQPLWSADTGAPIISSPSVVNGVVFVGSDSGAVSGFGLTSGALLWSAQTGGPVRSSPVIANGALYVGSDDGALHEYVLSAPPAPPPRPTLATLHHLSTPIRHIVVVYQENHSFDDVLGALCVQLARCDGATSGQLPNGSTIALGNEPDVVPLIFHHAAAQRAAIDGGRMDGFGNLTGCTAKTGYACYAQYQPSQIPNLAALAQNYVISDRTFETDSVPSWGSHLDLAAAQLDGFIGDNPIHLPASPTAPAYPWGCDSFKDMLWSDGSGAAPVYMPSCIPGPDGTGPYRASSVQSVPTIMDRLDGAGFAWSIYSLDPQGPWSICPSFGECTYGTQVLNGRAQAQFANDARAGTLPNLSLLIPAPANSQHNQFSMLQGDNWIGQVVSAVMNGPDWSSTAIFITYDDCGCFYDHVPPPAGLGIREPMVIVSPYARPSSTDSATASFSSMLAFTEHVYNLQPLFTTDASAYDYLPSFNFLGGSGPPGPTVAQRLGLRNRPLPRRERRELARHRRHPYIT